MPWLADLQGLSSLARGQRGICPHSPACPGPVSAPLPSAATGTGFRAIKEIGEPPVPPSVTPPPPHQAIRWHFRVSCFCPSAGAKGCGKPFFPSSQCPAPPSHNVCSSMQGGEAEAPGKRLLFKNFYFPSISQDRQSCVRPILSPPPIMSCCLVQH